MKHNIVWYDIPALDLDRAVRFYSAVLGAPVEKEDVGGVPIGWLGVMFQEVVRTAGFGRVVVDEHSTSRHTARRTCTLMPL